MAKRNNVTLKKVVNDTFPNYALNEEKTNLLKSILLSMLKDIVNTCDKYRIKYCAAYGTVLGAARHSGYIPWDDDIDIFVQRNDLHALREALIKEFPDKYLMTLPGEVKNDPCRFAKIMLKGTKYVEIEYSGLPWNKDFWRGLSIDVFILDYVPASSLIKKCNSLLNKIYCGAASFTMDYKFPAPVILDFAKINKEVNKWYSKRRRIGFLFSFLKTEKWVRKNEKMLAKIKTGDYLTNGCSPHLYLHPAFPADWFINPVKLSFENIDINIPRDYHGFLQICYGNWEKIPDQKERERHIVLDIDFGTHKG